MDAALAMASVEHMKARRGAFRLFDDGTLPPRAPQVGPRIGIREAAHEPWRWYVPDNRYVSGG